MSESETKDKPNSDVADFIEWVKVNKINLILVIPIFILFITAFLSFTNRAQWILNILLFTFVLFIGALSLDLEVGSVGLPNFGKVAFFALGAYISSLTYTAGVPLPIGVAFALIVCGFFGFIIAIPTVKLRADYFAIMTIAGAEVIRFLLQNEERYFYFKGTPLISNSIKTDFVALFNGKIEIFETLGLGIVRQWHILLVIIFALISLFVYWIVEEIRKSPYGRTLRAIREDDITVTSVGKNVYRFRWQVTTFAGVLAGLAGVMYGIVLAAFEHGDFRPFLTFELFVFIIIGGLGNSRGVFAGVLLVQVYIRAAQADIIKKGISLRLFPEMDIFGDLFNWLQLDIIINPDNTRLIILGTILILFLLFKPQGLIPEPRTNNSKYLNLVPEEVKKRSDDAIKARQSLTEKARLTGEELDETGE
ncbi:MAG: hypothetical protein HeimC3_25110 [Candidatus Heimdallarchaeota archaeon LC_3]|nr:MAG: hypothetical protein HeimC3_25110 [Candidatus Heimdallarchaeota archaeon LC_3]